MPSKTNEKAFEDHIEQYFLEQNGYKAGDPHDFDRHFCVDKQYFWLFLEATQQVELDKLRDRPDWQRLILERLDRKIKKDGLLAVLKKGLAIDDAHLQLLYRNAYSDLNPDVLELFEANIFSISRQVRFSESESADSIDMVLFINGIAVVTFELKNPWTGQTVYHGRQQYMKRDHTEPIFTFARCLVHFTLDPDMIEMTCQLAGKSTIFLPFNKGYKDGKGNPPNRNGFKTSYLWEEVLTRQSLTNIIEHFAKLIETKNKKTGKKSRKLFFPRYHQLDVVRKLLKKCQGKSVGGTYLIQHSAGSGKSNSITWLSYQLIELYNKAGTKNVFDSVIVVTDRRLLDKQIRDNIKSFAEIKNVVAHAESSQQLKMHLENGKKLIITTIQKFPYIIEGINSLSDRKFAVIVDEAHSSQGGSSADMLNIILGVEDTEDEISEEGGQEYKAWKAKMEKAMKGRKIATNASYFAFTATPKNSTLEKFGRRRPDGSFAPFHLYSMKQAIEEGFILDVLANYTTYKSYYQVQKSIEDNPLFETIKAQKKLRAYVEAHPETIAVKAKIMLDHFNKKIYQTRKLKGKAKAMVVTRNIENAIRYFIAIRKQMAEMNLPFKAIIAFSGSKTVDGIEYTENSINGFPSKDISEKFETDEYKILVVANKFLTGFDQPLLHTMYIDKRLQGVLAVQAISRLNRCNKKLGKKDTFVLDFYNSVSDIKSAFDPYYTSTTLTEPTDANVLHDLLEAMDNVGIYEQSEIEEFNEKFFNRAEAEELHPIIDKVAERFDELDDEDHKIDFKIKAKQFVKIYGQIACLISFDNVKWEMLHWFLKFLIPKLKIKDPTGDTLNELLESVDLSTYGLERTEVNTKITLDEDETEMEPQNPNPRGYHGGPEDEDPLDAIITAFNERHFSGWDATPQQQRVKLISIAEQIHESPDYHKKVLGNPDQQNSKLALEKMIQLAINAERKRELELYRNYAGDDAFKQAFDSSIMRILSIRAKDQRLFDNQQ